MGVTEEVLSFFRRIRKNPLTLESHCKRLGVEGIC